MTYPLPIGEANLALTGDYTPPVGQVDLALGGEAATVGALSGVATGAARSTATLRSPAPAIDGLSSACWSVPPPIPHVHRGRLASRRRSSARGTGRITAQGPLSGAGLSSVHIPPPLLRATGSLSASCVSRSTARALGRRDDQRARREEDYWAQWLLAA